VIPKAKAEDYVIVCGVFIAGNADSNAKIYKNNYEATKLAIKCAMKGLPQSMKSSPRRKPSILSNDL